MRRAAAPAKVGSWILSSELSSRGLCAIVPLAGHFAPEEGIDAAQGSQAFVIILLLQACAPLAQLDRASGYEPEGREFESLRARHFLLCQSCFFVYVAQQPEIWPFLHWFYG